MDGEAERAPDVAFNRRRLFYLKKNMTWQYLIGDISLYDHVIPTGHRTH